MWNELIKTALLGTEKLPLQESIMPQAIKNILDKTANDDAEGKFLKATALVWTYTQAGQSPMQVILPEIAPAPTETQQFLSQEANIILKTLLNTDNFNPYLFEFFLDKCLENQWVIPENKLVEVLSMTDKNLQTKTKQVIGKRGLWLSQFNQAWQWLDAENISENEIWEEGKSSERRTFFANLRAKNPQKAIEILEASWQQASAKDRKDFINLLESNLSNADEPFLNAVADELAQSKTPKPVTLETLQAINLLRLKIPNSIFGQQIFDKIATYIQQKKGILGIGASLKLALPKDEDSFWNGTQMNQNFGFDKLSSAKGVSDAEYWFGELLRHLNPSFWINYFGGDIPKALSFLLSADGMTKQNKSLYIYQFSEALQWADTPIIQLFFREAKDQIKDTRWKNLVKRLPITQQENIIQKYISVDFQTLNANLLENTQEEWSQEFSRFIIKALVAEMQKSSYYGFSDKDFINRLSCKLSLKIKSEISEAGKQMNQEWQRNYWENTFAENLLKQLNLKEEINKI